MDTKPDYSVAIGISKFVAFIGWVAIIIGVAGVVMSVAYFESAGGLRSYTLLTAAVVLGASSIIISLFGLVLVVVGQTSRAVMDNANYSAAMLEEMQKSHLPSEQQVKEQES